MALRPPTAQDFERWLADGFLTREQTERLAVELTSAETDSAAEGQRGFNPLTVAYYLGALMIMSALGWFLYDQWDSLGKGGILAVSCCYLLLLAGAGLSLRFRFNYPVAGGLLITAAVSVVPLVVYSLEGVLGLWPRDDPGSYNSYYVWINGSWVVMELATMLVGFATLVRVRFTFLTMPIAIAFWFLSMDITQIVKHSAYVEEPTRAWCSVVVGAIMLLLAFALDRRMKEDISFWLYLGGMLAFWGGLTDMDSGSEWGKAIYALINLAIGFVGLYLLRRVFLPFATLGLAIYLEHLARRVFRDSVLFPGVVATLGLVVIFAAVYLQRHRRAIDLTLNRFRPARLRV
jgi:hypothetical protein